MFTKKEATGFLFYCIIAEQKMETAFLILNNGRCDEKEKKTLPKLFKGSLACCVFQLLCITGLIGGESIFRKRNVM